MNVLVEESSLLGVANAIRGRNGSAARYKPGEMGEAVRMLGLHPDTVLFDDKSGHVAYNGQCRGMVYGLGRFWMAGAFGILSSEDGKVWESKGSSGMTGIGYKAEKLWAIGSSAIYRSSDGETWEPFAINNIGGWGSLSYANGILAMCRTSKYVTRSMDGGETWSYEFAGTLPTMPKRMTDWDGRFYASSNSYLVVSQDAFTWEYVYENGEAVKCSDVISLGDRLLLLIPQNPLIGGVRDNWTGVRMLLKDGSMTEIVRLPGYTSMAAPIASCEEFQGRLALACGLETKGGSIFISEDNGETWRRSVQAPQNLGGRMCAGNGVLVYRGTATSADTWWTEDPDFWKGPQLCYPDGTVITEEIRALLAPESVTEGGGEGE